MLTCRRFDVVGAESGQLLICDKEAGYRVTLELEGTFPSAAHRLEYAEEIIRALNAAPIPTLECSRWNAKGERRHEGVSAQAAPAPSNVTRFQLPVRQLR